MCRATAPAIVEAAIERRGTPWVKTHEPSGARWSADGSARKKQDQENEGDGGPRNAAGWGIGLFGKAAADGRIAAGVDIVADMAAAACRPGARRCHRQMAQVVSGTRCARPAGAEIAWPAVATVGEPKPDNGWTCTKSASTDRST